MKVNKNISEKDFLERLLIILIIINHNLVKIEYKHKKISVYNMRGKKLEFIDNFLNIIHFLIYCLIAIILLNWYINYTIVIIIQVVLAIIIILYIKMNKENRKLKKKIREIK